MVKRKVSIEVTPYSLRLVVCALILQAIGNLFNLVPEVAETLYRFNWALQYSSPRKESADKVIIQEIMSWLLDRAIAGQMKPGAEERTCVVLVRGLSGSGRRQR